MMADTDKEKMCSYLLEDYKLADNRVNLADTRIIQLIGVGLPITAGIIGLILNQPRTGAESTATATATSTATATATNAVIDYSGSSLWVIGSMPFFFLVFYALIIYVLYDKVAYTHYCRFLADQINKACCKVTAEFDKQPLQRFKQELPQGYYSGRIALRKYVEDRELSTSGSGNLLSGQILFFLLYVVFIILGLGVLLVTIVVAGMAVGKNDISLGWAIGLGYGFVMLVEVLSLWGAITVLPNEFDTWRSRGQVPPSTVPPSTAPPSTAPPSTAPPP
jgi:hypothetical protein